MIVNAYSTTLKGSYLNTQELNFWSYDVDIIEREELWKLAYKDISYVTIDDINLNDFPTNLYQKKYSEFVIQFKQSIMDLINSRRKRNSILSIHRCKPLFNSLSLSWRMIKSCTISPSLTDLAFLSKTNSRIAEWTPLCWNDLVRNTKDWLNYMYDIIVRFIFVLPSTISDGPQLVVSKYLKNSIVNKIQSHLNTLNSPIRIECQNYLKLIHSPTIRQRIFFPDRKLVQYDSGKLQTLCQLLRELKLGGHKCLIFTQMSKMLDILEIFLNLNGHTYVRLDGSTGIEKRQKLMDRFNNDPKIFCFILSTRSGGLGINLTGADTVIFYDSDWNPAMDAQAQDRAHRIGQTKEVHIYRLVCKSTIEENILTKAKQKRHLDFLVMSEGDFNVGSLFTTNNLLELLGEEEKEKEIEKNNELKYSQKLLINNNINKNENEKEINSEIDVEAAMAAVEDEEDVTALKGAKAEVAQEQLEFDENAPTIVELDIDENEVNPSQKSQSQIQSQSLSQVQNQLQLKGEDDMEAEFAKWQESVGGKDFKALEAALKPIERYALSIRLNIDPYYSLHYLSEQQKMLEIQADEQNQEWDIETLEQQKEEEEYRALADGELLAVNLTKEELQSLKSEYAQEKSRRIKERKLRQLTGEGWSQIIDEVSGIPFWYNEDTGEASYAQPEIIKMNKILRAASERKYNAFPIHLILIVLSYLEPYPDRINCSYISDRWRRAVSNPCFYKKVLSIEAGAKELSSMKDHQLEENTFTSIKDALQNARPGETITLGSGHHFEEDIILKSPIRIIGAEDDSTKVVVELSGGIELSEYGGRCALIGITFTRARRSRLHSNLFNIKNSRVYVRKLIYYSIYLFI